MIISEKKYQAYKEICISLRKFHEMEDKPQIIIDAINQSELLKSIFDKLNPSYRNRWKNDNQ